MNAREEVIARIRHALADLPDDNNPADIPVPRPYHTYGTPPTGSPESVTLLAERLTDYGASVRMADEETAAAAIAEALATRGAYHVVAPQGFPREWQAELAAERLLSDDPRLSVDALDALDGVLTTAAVAIATTGTVILDGGQGQGRRALTLVPDYHLCVVRTEQIVTTVPEALARLNPVRPLTFISGPSATSDIELERVEGVHGPRTLDVLILH